MRPWVPIRAGWPARALRALLRGGALLILGAALALAAAVLPFPYPTARLSPDRGGPLLIRDRHGALLYSAPGRGGVPLEK